VYALHPLGTASHNLQRLHQFMGILQGGSRTIGLPRQGYAALRHVILNSQYVRASSCVGQELAEEIRRLRMLRPHDEYLGVGTVASKAQSYLQEFESRRHCLSTVGDICGCGVLK
jgi:hypothetical protein